ncbi:hypothetical protein J4466_00230 [Candidatus Pacearchaeota archaeon]|nr:hypothetical protein [Candidatus Pacearchaeota archaeon]
MKSRQESHLKNITRNIDNSIANLISPNRESNIYCNLSLFENVVIGGLLTGGTANAIKAGNEIGIINAGILAIYLRHVYLAKSYDN